jgi:hypothetical protein
MKRPRLIALSITLFISPILFAQAEDSVAKGKAKPHSAFYAGIETGYALPIGKSYDSEDIDIVENYQAGTISYDRKKVSSLGAGFNTGIIVGYFSGQFGAEAGVNFLYGNKYSVTYTYIGQNSTSVWTQRRQLRMINLTPSVFLHTTGSGRVNARLSIGAAIGLKPEIKFESFGDTGPDYVLYYAGGTAWGFTSGIGAGFSLTDHLTLVADMRFIHQVYCASYSTSANKKDKHWFDDSYTTAVSGANIPDVKPCFNLSSFGLRVAMVYSLYR